MTREELQIALRHALDEVEAGKAGELADARSETSRWKSEWEALMGYVSNIRESRIWADQAYFKAKQEASDLAKRVGELERENSQLREMVEADNVLCHLLERQIELLTKAKEAA